MLSFKKNDLLRQDGLVFLDVSMYIFYSFLDK